MIRGMMQESMAREAGTFLDQTTNPHWLASCARRKANGIGKSRPCFCIVDLPRACKEPSDSACDAEGLSKTQKARIMESGLFMMPSHPPEWST